MFKRLGLQLISWGFCLLVPWVAGSIIYFAAQERWLLVLASFLLSASMMLIGLESLIRSTLEHLEQPQQRDLDP